MYKHHNFNNDKKQPVFFKTTYTNDPNRRAQNKNQCLPRHLVSTQNHPRPQPTLTAHVSTSLSTRAKEPLGSCFASYSPPELTNRDRPPSPGNSAGVGRPRPTLCHFLWQNNAILYTVYGCVFVVRFAYKEASALI